MIYDFMCPVCSQAWTSDDPRGRMARLDGDAPEECICPTCEWSERRSTAAWDAEREDEALQEEWDVDDEDNDDGE